MSAMHTKGAVHTAGYVNKRRVLDERQKKFYAEAEARVTRS